MLPSQKELFYDLATSLEYWSNTLTEQVNGKKKVFSDELIDSYKILSERLSAPEDIEAFQKVVFDGMNGLIHSMLVMFDGGTRLSEYTNLSIIDDKGNEFPKYLHEEWPSYLDKLGDE